MELELGLKSLGHLFLHGLLLVWGGRRRGSTEDGVPYPAVCWLSARGEMLASLRYDASGSGVAPLGGKEATLTVAPLNTQRTSRFQMWVVLSEALKDISCALERLTSPRADKITWYDLLL